MPARMRLAEVLGLWTAEVGFCGFPSENAVKSALQTKWAGARDNTLARKNRCCEARLKFFENYTRFRVGKVPSSRGASSLEPLLSLTHSNRRYLSADMKVSRLLVPAVLLCASVLPIEVLAGYSFAGYYKATFDTAVWDATATMPAAWYAVDSSNTALSLASNKVIPSGGNYGYFLLQNDPDSTANKDYTDYALGTYSNGGSSFGFSLTNDSGSALSGFDISFSGLSTVGDSVIFSYSLDGSNWTVLKNMSFGSASYADLSASLGSSLVLPQSASVFFRWSNNAGSAAYVDDVVVTATAIPEPSTYALFLGVATLGLVGWRRFRRK